MSSPRLEHEGRPHRDENQADRVVPSNRLADVEDGEEREHDERDDLLNRLQLRRRPAALGADAIGRRLETVIEERDAPSSRAPPTPTVNCDRASGGLLGDYLQTHPVWFELGGHALGQLFPGAEASLALPGMYVGIDLGFRFDG